MPDRDWDRNERRRFDRGDHDRGDYRYEDRERDWDEARYSDRSREAVPDDRYTARDPDWRTERHGGGPGVVDRVKDWWTRNVGEFDRDRQHQDWDRDWNRPREHFGDRERWNEGNRHDRNMGVPGAGYTGYAYGGALGPAADSDRSHRGYEQTSSTRGTARGSYVGRGPKSWRRSDERIREDVNEELTRHPDVDASEIEVAVMNAEVTLTGTVSGRHEKREAEDCAWRVPGVKDVHVQLRIRQGVGSMIADVFKSDKSDDRR